MAITFKKAVTFLAVFFIIAGFALLLMVGNINATNAEDLLFKVFIIAIAFIVLSLLVMGIIALREKNS